MYDREKLIEAADTLLVAEHIGLEIKRTGSRRSILCPAHNDRHFGNCVLTEHGFRCFACGGHGSVIDLVMLSENVPLVEAMGIVADCCGGREYYQTDEKGPLPEHQVIGEGTRAFLGIHNRPVDKLLPADPEDEDSFYDYSVVTGELCRLRRVRISSSPLSDLMESDWEGYRGLILGKAREKYDFYTGLLDRLRHPGNEPEDAILADMVDTASFADVAAFLQEQAKTAENLLIDFGGTVPQKEAFQNGICTKSSEAPF